MAFEQGSQILQTSARRGPPVTPGHFLSYANYFVAADESAFLALIVPPSIHGHHPGTGSTPCRGFPILARVKMGIPMAKVTFAAAVARVYEIEKAMNAVPERAYTAAIEKMFFRELDSAVEVLFAAAVVTTKDAKALVVWLCGDEAACGQPQLLRKILPGLKAA